MNRSFHPLPTLLLALCGLGAAAPAQAESFLVHSQEEYTAASKRVQAGDTIILANGTWEDFEVRFTGEGTADRPITLTAEEKGRVVLSGQSNLRLSGRHLVVSGLVFRNGHTATSEVVAFRTNKENLAFHSRVTEVVIDGFNNPERSETDFWVVMYGQHNRFDHNYLAGKSNNGVTMAVRLDSADSLENHHRIDHNFFGHRPVLGSNGGETLRIGTSRYSLEDSFTVVENNYFERCDGEVEIISSKSGGNVFRGNVFFESRGTLTLRHGNDNLVENNVFFGNGVDHTGGIRVINKRQTVRNNYLEGLTGSRFGSALTIMNGVPDSPINRYHQVEGALVRNNTLIDSEHIHLAAGSDAERSAVPIDSRFLENLVFNNDGRDPFSVFDDISGIEFDGNVANPVDAPALETGFRRSPVKLERSDSGLLYPVGDAFADIGVPRGLPVLSRNQTGPAWFTKPAQRREFGSGETRPVPDRADLARAVAGAGPGDVLQLTGRHYLAEKVLVIDKPLTLKAADGVRPVIEFERNTLFEIADGGSLRLEGLRISGGSAPDVAGNTLLRTSRYSMLNNYRLHLVDVEVVDLNVNHSFNVLTVSRSTFADEILIEDSTFQNVTGAVLELNRETDDLGLYNAEYVTVRNSEFEDIGEALMVVYRGGTDESTFGPHVLVSDNQLHRIGLSTRNRAGASMLLHGAQQTRIFGNRFEDSRGILIEHTVGEPRTRIEGNAFIGTPAPEVSGDPATVLDNTLAPGRDS